MTTSRPGAEPSTPQLSLENLKKQAKSLLKTQQAGDPAAAARIAAVAPKSAQNGFQLADAQFVIAREHGFPSWPKLKTYAESIAVNGKRFRPFQTSAAYYDERAQGLLSAHHSRLPAAADQIRQHHPVFAKLSDADVFGRSLTVDDVRLVTAHEHGFETWSKLTAHVQRLASGEDVEPFLAAFSALERGDFAAFAAIVRRDPSLVNARGTNGNTLLNLAGSCRQIEACRLLLELGTDPNVGNVRGWTPLHQAGYSNQPDLAQMLLDAGASVDVSALGDGGTPLVVALFWGNVEVADVLARHGVVPGNLRAAAGVGRVDLLAEFFDGAGSLKPSAGEHRGFYRPHSGFPVWHPSDDPQEIINEAFVYAAKSGRLEALDFLLRRGADVNGDPYRGTALLWAAYQRGDVDTARWLLDHGAEVDLKATFGGPQHGQGITALHLAAQAGCLPMVKFLIERGADPALRDDLHGGDALGAATFFGQEEVKQYLEGLRG